MAALNLSVEITGLRDLEKLRAFCDPKLLAKATRGGIAYATKAATTAASRQVREHYPLTAGRLRSDIGNPRFFDAGQGATLAFSRRPPSAMQYGGRDNGSGLTMKVFRSGSRQPVARGFIGRGKIAGLPFRRVSDGPGAKLEFVYGPSVGSALLRRGRYAPEMQAALNARINEQFIKGFQRVLDSASRGYGT
jgi:hypothetical protein